MSAWLKVPLLQNNYLRFSQVVNVESNNKAVTFRRDKGQNSDIYQEIIVKGKVDTVTKAFNFAVNKYGDQVN